MVLLLLATAPPALTASNPLAQAPGPPDFISAGLLGVPTENPGVNLAQHSGVTWDVQWGHMMHACMHDLGHEIETQAKVSSCTVTVTAS